jgi:hypothetical protein
MNICVFCSANDLGEKYTAPAKALARLLAEAGHTLIWGGSDVGLMKIMADGVQEGGGKIVGVSLEYYKENARKNADEMIIAKNLGERRALLLERSDVIVSLIGGLGTLDELTEIMELRKQRRHDKLCIIVNTDGFYDGFRMQMERIFAEGFLSAKEQADANNMAVSDIIRFVDTPEEAMDIIGQATNDSPSMEVPQD